jgi:opacity protein-like surface antigen
VKKLLYTLPLLSTLLFADSTIYVGTGYIFSNENFSYQGIDKSFSSNGARLKIGYGDIKAYAVELSMDYIDNKEAVLSPNDAEKIGFNLELLKSFDVNIFAYPFVKAGFGGGYFKTDADVVNSSLTYGTWNLGGGLFVPYSQHIDFELAYEFKSLSYQKTDPELSSSPKSTLHIGYVGINFRF